MLAICATCGVQQTKSACCPICEDSRQYVPPSGQQWTTLAELQTSHRNVLREEEPGIWSIRTEPAVGIGQCAYLLQTREGNLLWDCVTFLDEETIAKMKDLGSIRAIAVSHPHYYSTMSDWSAAFDAPVYIHEDDKDWVVQRPRKLELWSGETHPLFGGITLVRSGGHFAGYQVGHWAKEKGLLFAGDQPQVCMDRHWVSFLYSYPNMIPFNAATVNRIAASLEPFDFDRIYGAFGRNVLSGAKEVITRSVERYLQAITDH